MHHFKLFSEGRASKKTITATGVTFTKRPNRFRPTVRSVRFLEHLMESLKGTGRSKDLRDGYIWTQYLKIGNKLRRITHTPNGPAYV